MVRKNKRPSQWDVMALNNMIHRTYKGNNRFTSAFKSPPVASSITSALKLGAPISYSEPVISQATFKITKEFLTVECNFCGKDILSKNEFLLLASYRSDVNGLNLCYPCLHEIVQEIPEEERLRQIQQRLGKEVADSL